ncbi:SdpI family protein [Streptomyces sp. NPDC101152]|uniref:SdpI family protein n=1 Tax=Streptomyces sp. NPDC101152 TaxID=3366116 RepID=UPI003806B00F
MNTHLVVGIVLTVLYLSVGVGVLTTVRASRNGTLRRNTLVGVRTSATLSDDAAWRAGHHEARRHYVLLIPVLVAGAIAVLVNAFAQGPFWGFAVIVGVSGVIDIVIAARSVSAANAAARRS